MMNKIRSARLHLVKFLFVVPLIAVLLLAFRDRQGKVAAAAPAAAVAVISAPRPPAPAPPAPVPPVPATSAV